MANVLVQNACPFAIRSGGHTPFPDNNIGAPGITIDLSRLNAVSLSNTTTGYTASVGPGARWGDVYNYLTPKGIMVPGGRAADVGVGGLVLGGLFCLDSVSSEICLPAHISQRWKFLLCGSLRLRLRQCRKFRGGARKRQHRQRQQPDKLRSMASPERGVQQLRHRDTYRSHRFRIGQYLGRHCALPSLDHSRPD